MIRKLSLFVGLVSSSALLSQTLQEAIRKTENERVEEAARDFRALLAKEPNRGEYYFYFGENYFKAGDLDSASIMYNKGAELNATQPLNYVGKGKILLAQGDVNGAKAEFYKAASIGGNKNAEVMRQTAEAWLVTSNKNADEAIAMANAAIKVEPKNPEGHIILGDAQLEKNPTDGSTPIKSYQQASKLDPKSPKGLLRQGRLYQRARNYQLALDFYTKAIAHDPAFAPAYREIAELYTLAGQPAKSIENWQKYLALNNSDQARYRFMSALFANKQYPEAIKEYETLKQSNFSNLYLERLAGYSYAELAAKDSSAAQKGLEAIDRFFSMAGSDFKYIPDDYKYRGKLLGLLGKDSLALIEMQKAITLDPKKAPQVYSELADMSQKKKDYAGVAKYLRLKMGAEASSMTNSDWFDLGKAYYFQGSAKSRTANEQLAVLKQKKKPATPEIKTTLEEADSLYRKADSAFVNLVKMNPSWAMGYVWRGRASSQYDPDAKTDTAKVQYEKVLELIKPEERTGSMKNFVIEAYEYLGYYYVTKKDDAQAKETWKTVKELDPGNKKAEFFLNPPKPAAPKQPGK